MTDLTMKRLMALSLGMALAVDAHLQENERRREQGTIHAGVREVRRRGEAR